MTCKKQNSEWNSGRGENISPSVISSPATLAEAETLINGLTNFERMDPANIRYDTTEFDLSAFTAWLDALGNPQDSAKAVIHVVGTKGKGSVCAMLSAGLRGIGVRAGMYTSPHLYRLTERIVVDGREIDDESFCRLTGGLEAHLRAKLSERDARRIGMRSAFELLTAMAFLYFREHQCGMFVVEAGMGGRLDATNVFRNPEQKLINVIMSVGLEHTGVLGQTVEEIAAEKAAVIQQHTQSVVLARQHPEYRETVRAAVLRRMRDVGCSAKLTEMDECPKPVCLNIEERFWQFDIGGVSVKAVCPFPGEHQAWNMQTALYALSFACGGAMPEHVALAMKSAVWPGRFEILRGQPTPFVVDGAHCVLSTEAMARTWMSCFPGKIPVLVCGFMADKNVAWMFKLIAELMPVTHVFVCRPEYSRAMEVSEVLEHAVSVFGQNQAQLTACGSLREAVSLALNSGCPVLVFGSLALVHEGCEIFNELTENGRF